jgi:WD40-like Beta Propeller Repeat
MSMPVSTITRTCALLGGAATAMALSGCGHSQPSAAPTVTVTTSASPAPSASGGTASPVAAVPPAMVAVTTAGALVVLNPANGTVTRTLVPAHVIGDEISVSPAGLVYFVSSSGCSDEIESVPVGGGSPTPIASGTLPAVSPDGTKLAYVTEPSTALGCNTADSGDASLYTMQVRSVSSGAQTVYPMVPASQADSTLPAPISHLSWAVDDARLAVSVASFQDNEGWNLVIVDTTVAKDYFTGPGTSYVPVTGQPTAQRSYLREGVFMPDGELFVSRACCAGDPTQNTSRLMWEVNTAGTLVHQVAIGYPNLDHVSLDVSADGSWLLYVAGTDLYVSHDGDRPSELTTGLIAAAWD